MLTKAAGIIGLGLVGYDIHKTGIHHANMNMNEIKASSLSKQYMEELATDSPSVLKQELRHKLFHFNLEENISGVFTSFMGYLKGVEEMVVHNAIPAVLAVGALIKNPLSKYCALGLLGYGGLVLAQEIFGIGKPTTAE